MKRVKKGKYYSWKIFAVPILILVITATGLSAALIGDGYWDWISWMLLGVVALLGIVPILSGLKIIKLEQG